MELVYLYIKSYGNIYENVEFNFSDNYTASFDDNNRLIIQENEKTIKILFVFVTMIINNAQNQFLFQIIKYIRRFL